MDGSVESRVDHELDNWLRWLPRWRPGTHRGRTRLCRLCLGSPVIAAAGLEIDVPHAVQHALSMRMKLVIDASVDEYTDLNLPLLRRELRADEQRRSSTAYRPTEGLEPEFRGLDLDPQPAPDAPYLFTFTELAEADAPLTQRPAPPPPLSAEEKAAIRVELRLADDYAVLVGKRVCGELAANRERIARAIAAFVEPHVQALLADLGSSLDSR